MQLRVLGYLAILAICCGAWGGCSSESESNAASADAKKAASPATDEAERLKQARDSFVPPATLAEVDKGAGSWIDGPVLDALGIAHEEQAKLKPLVSAADALKLKNDSAESNTKILSALGRLPESEGDVNWDATILRHIPRDITSSNPVLGSTTEEFDIGSLTGVEIFTFNARLEPFASKDAVVSWQTSADRKIDKIVLRDDLVWSDGKPVTAHDVEFAYHTIMDPQVPIPAQRSGTDQMLGVKAYDDHTVVYFHPESSPTNVWNINFPALPKHIYEKSLKDDKTFVNSPYHVKYENEPVNSGPYKLVKRVRGQELILERREDYYMHGGKQVRAKPYFKQIHFKIIKDSTTALASARTGQVDEMLLNPEQWQTQTGGDDFYRLNTKARGEEWTTAHFVWNLKAPYFKDLRVRQAMGYAFNHKEMIDKLCYGLYQPCRGIYNASSWMAPKPMPEPIQQDLGKAEKLLEEAGWTDSDGDGVRDKEIGKERIRFEFTLLCPVESTLAQSIAELMKQNLAQVGVECNIRLLQSPALHDKELKHEFQAAVGAWGTGTDPDTTINIFGTGEGRNFGEYSNPEVDKLYAEGKREFDREKRAAIYGKIHLLLWHDQPYTWLYSRSSFYAFNKELRGYKFSPRGPFHYAPGFSSFWRVPANP